VLKTPAGFATGEGLFVNVIAFAAPAVEALLALAEGDSVALKNGDARPSFDLGAHAVLTVYHVTRKRQAVKDEAAWRPERPCILTGDSFPGLLNA
jgi:hypothetical protein